ncbi:hypothetical protein BH24DEI2_BH24DEI2_09650 [soil metagenome]
MGEDQRLEYQSLIRSIVDQAEAMEDPDQEDEMLFDKVEALSIRVEELRDLIDLVYG